MIDMYAFMDELQKISASAPPAAVEAVKKYWKPASLVAGGAAGYHLGKKELDKYMLGRQVYEQMHSRGG